MEKKIVYILLFLLPTQLAFHFWPSWAFVFGIRVDYLAPAVYLTDVLALFLILTNLSIYKKYVKYLLALLVFAAVNTFYSTSPPESVYKWLKVFEMAGVVIYFVKSKIDTEKIFRTLFYSAVLFSLIGIVQFLLERSIGGPLYFLGERSFTLMTPGMALVKISGQNFLRGYSTFSHPNSLAGYLGIILILFLDLRKKNIYDILGIVFVLLGFILSFSLTAEIALVVVLLIKYIFNRTKTTAKLTYTVLYGSFFISLLLPIFAKNISLTNFGFGQNLAQRLDLSFLSGNMIAEKFWVGEGLNTFIANIPRFRALFSYSWLLQPVHNVPLLVFSESGIFGLLVLFILFYQSVKRSLTAGVTTATVALLFIMITWTMDHYWFTLQQNLLLVSILLGLSFRIKEWKTG